MKPIADTPLNVLVSLNFRSCICAIFFCFCNSHPADAQAKSWQFIPLLDNYDRGITGDVLSWNDTLFFAYPRNQYWNNLAKYNGSHIQKMTNDIPGLNIIGGFCTKNNKIYFVNQKQNRNLAVYNRADSSVTEFSNPDNGYGVEPKPIFFKNEIYYPYNTESGGLVLVRLSENGPQLIIPPANISTFYYYVDNDYILFSAGTYVLKFDGLNFNLIEGRTNYFEIQGNIVKCQGKYFTTVTNENFDERLAEINDTGFIIKENLPANTYIYSNLAVFDNKIWFTYNEEIAMKYYSHFASFSGDSIKVEVPDCKKRLLQSFIYKNEFYFRTEGYPDYLNTSLNKYQNGKIDTVALPAIIKQAWHSSFSFFFEKGGILYTDVYATDNSSKGGPAAFDGNKMVMIPSQDSTFNAIIPGITFRNSLVSYARWSSMPYGTMGSLSILSDTIEINACNGENAQLGLNQAGSTYQWQIYDGQNFNDLTDNVTFLNTNSSVLTIQNAATSFAEKYFRCMVDGQASVIYRLRFENRFIGSPYFSRNWDNPLYWSCGVVPDENTDVYLNSGIILMNIPVTIRSLTIDPSVKLTLSNGVTLKITK